MKKVLFILFAVTLLFAACGDREDKQREKLMNEIKKAEQEFVAKDFNLTLEKSQRLMNLYLNFVEKYPQDSLAPELLFCCAAVATASQQEKFAITLYQRIYDEYPNHALRPIALLEQALAYDNMGDAERAKPLYEQFLIVFPDHPYIEDVKHLLDMVDKTPEEWEQLMLQFENQEEFQ
ncbi:MAG: tetratricopeptide repeat protein [Bacteroidales bacterium]|nr:tetratricopeptide repeat protein [Bacteroidales bacterium]